MREDAWWAPRVRFGRQLGGHDLQPLLDVTWSSVEATEDVCRKRIRKKLLLQSKTPSPVRQRESPPEIGFPIIHPGTDYAEYSLVHILIYPHPALRHHSKPVQRIDQELRDIARSMLRLMYEAEGVGLAANQVELPLRLFVLNLDGNPNEGQEHVFVNPVLGRPRGNDEQQEGCLSLPGLYGQVKRPETIRLNAYNLEGEEFEADLDGMFARVVQHEIDHLDGVLFIDRLSTTGALAAKSALEEFELEFQGRRQRGEMPSDEQIASRLADWEKKYC
jgi:peptide deformylase